ncbi:hypothetical protein LguiA_017850 [Lonicera macranthoides]
MRGRNSSKKQGMEVDKNLDKLKEEEEQEGRPHLSGAYIRSLVKQLSSSRTKATHGDGDGDEDGGGLLSGNCHRHQNVTKNGKQEQNQPPAHHHHQQQEQETIPPPPQQHHKKQVRRRLHTSRPYQERLLNMAEARREIVTALKFHRASMKQANTENPQSQTLQTPPAPPLAQSPLEHAKLKSRRNPRIYASTTATNTTPNFPNYRDNLSYASLYSLSANPPPYWAVPPVAPPPPIPENFNLNLPNQTLGLNLNFQDFSNLDTTLYHNSYFCPSPISADHEVPPYVKMLPEEGEPCLVDSGTGSSFMSIEGGGGDQSGLHQAMDDEEMAEIRSLGEQHQMEWNDKMNLVTSAWWFKFLKNVEIGPEENGEVDDGFHPLIDQVMEFPDWINNANESCLQQQLDDHCSDDYLQDPALSCMDIGEIEGMYEEWLA